MQSECPAHRSAQRVHRTARSANSSAIAGTAWLGGGVSMVGQAQWTLEQDRHLTGVSIRVVSRDEDDSECLSQMAGVVATRRQSHVPWHHLVQMAARLAGDQRSYRALTGPTRRLVAGRLDAGVDPLE